MIEEDIVCLFSANINCIDLILSFNLSICYGKEDFDIDSEEETFEEPDTTPPEEPCVEEPEQEPTKTLFD